IAHHEPQLSLAVYFPIYWNNSVANSPGTAGNSTLQSTIQAFVANFADGQPYTQADKSADYTIIQQYGVSNAISPVLAWVGDYVDSKPTQSTISDSKIQSYLASLFTAGPVKA